MSSTPTINNAYLITSRNFPQNIEELTPELTKMYFDIASAVNIRTNGIFDNFQVVTGERWFNTATQLQAGTTNKRQTYRQVYAFGAIAAGGTLSFAHNISGGTLNFTHIYGTCITANPDYRPLPYASVTANANIELYADATNININVGAASPNLTSGIVVLEYLLN